jgi:hypothetical protein
LAASTIRSAPRKFSAKSITPLFQRVLADRIQRGADGAQRDARRTTALTTALRDVGVGLVIVTGSFAGTPTVSAALAYGIVEVLGSLLVALWWGRSAK